MERIKGHVISKIVVLILSATLVLPLFVKLDHIFEDHKHEVCITPFTNHFHEFEIDCDFHKFNSVTQYFIEYEYSNEEYSEFKNKDSFSKYFLLNSHRQLSFSLRAPPYALI